MAWPWLGQSSATVWPLPGHGSVMAWPWLGARAQSLPSHVRLSHSYDLRLTPQGMQYLHTSKSLTWMVQGVSLEQEITAAEFLSKGLYAWIARLEKEQRFYPRPKAQSNGGDYIQPFSMHLPFLQLLELVCSASLDIMGVISPMYESSRLRTYSASQAAPTRQDIDKLGSLSSYNRLRSFIGVTHLSCEFC